MSAVHYVYFIEAGDARQTWTKVGISTNPETRLKGLQTANPTTLRLARVFVVGDRQEAERAERVIHLLMADLSMRGEWFSCPAETIISRIEDLRALVMMEERGDIAPERHEVRPRTRPSHVATVVFLFMAAALSLYAVLLDRHSPGHPVIIILFGYVSVFLFVSYACFKASLAPNKEAVALEEPTENSVADDWTAGLTAQQLGLKP